jgi:glycosyltransferase involved in cell wall biosynthesis
MKKTIFENMTLLVITHNYTSFVKDPVEVLSRYFDHICVLVRHNPIADISLYLPINSLKPFNKSSMVDLRNKPDNVSVITTNIIYAPTANQYRKLGERHLKAVEKTLRRRRLKFDLIHAHFTWTAGYVGARLREIFDIPFVLTVHENKSWFLEEYDSNREEMFYTWKSADAITRPNSIDIPLLRKINENAVTVANGFAPEKFAPASASQARQHLCLPPDKRIVFGLGYLTERKGFRYLIEAMEHVTRMNPNVLCFIGGPGEQKGRLEQRIRQLRLEGSVRLVGAIAHNEVHLWMNACDLFVLPSLSESFGVVQLEAMACGKPVVATYNGGSEEVVASEEYGLLCQPANSRELAERILLALDREWDSDKNIEYAQRFTWETNAEKTLQVYESVLRKGHQQSTSGS